MKRLTSVLLAALLATASLVACAPKAPPPPVIMPDGSVEGAFLSADGNPIHYRSLGQGSPTLVFVHGWSCDGSYFAPQVQAFSRSHKVITLDLAGHGRSGKDRKAWTVEAYARDIQAVVEGLQLENVVLVGHSMSGYSIVEAARLMPTRIKALVPIDTLQEVNGVMTQAQLDGMLAPFKQNFKATCDGFVRQFFPEDADQALVVKVVNGMCAADPAIAIPTLEALFRHDIRPALTGLTLPIVAINADKWPTDLEGNRKVVPQFQVRLMKGLGHFPHLEQPDAFNRLLMSTLQELPSAP